MQKSYCDFMDEITADELYEGLLAYGFFTAKLPPVFTSVPFYDYCKTLSASFPLDRKEYISFRTMRNVSIPRQMGIPTPMSYQRLCATLRDYWSDIQNYFHVQTDGQSYRLSRIHIRKERGSKQIFDMNYKNWHVDGNPESDLLIHEKKVSRYLVKADISSCFPSIYTHSIPWALAGKKKAKATINESGCWYNKIDSACQNVKNGETHGLLIGPHASNLVSEIVLTAVDKKLYKQKYRFERNIDDFDCYVDNYETAERFLRDLETALRKYDLQLNHKKTKIIELPIEIEKNWKHQLSDLPTVGKSGMVEYPQANTFIDTALKLATETGDFAIINYAIKKLSGNRPTGKKLTRNAQKQAARRFMHLAALYPYLLPLMEEFVFTPYKVETEAIKLLSDTIYKNAKRVNDYESICYAVYFALRYDFFLEELDKGYVIKHADCILLVLTWLYYLKVNHWKRDASDVKEFKRKADDLKDSSMGRYWLFCYEALPAGSLSGDWKKMKQAGVSFIKPEFFGGE